MWHYFAHTRTLEVILPELTDQEIKGTKHRSLRGKIAALLTFANFLFIFFFDLYQRTGMLFPAPFFKRSTLIGDQVIFSLTGSVLLPLVLILIFSIFKALRTVHFRANVFIFWSCFYVCLMLLGTPTTSDELKIKDNQNYSEPHRLQESIMMQELDELKNK